LAALPSEWMTRRVIERRHDGKTLWKGLASGEATRFGRSYKVEDYYEVLSDAVVNTVSSMLQAADFQKAISGHAIGES
jgi:hypothetical protein